MSLAGGATVVQVTTWNSPYLGNFMASQLALADVVRQRFGLRTHFVLGPGADEHPWTATLDERGWTWSVLGYRRRAARRELDAVLRRTGAVLVHSHFTSADLPAAGAASAAGVPCVWHMHTGFLGYPARQRVKDLWKMRVVGRRAVARVIAVAPWLEALARRRGVPADRIVMVPNALVLDRFATLPDRAAARTRAGHGDDEVVALAFAWWPDVKGADVVVDAVERLAGRASPVVAHLVGEQRLRSFAAERFAGRPAPPWLRLSGFVDDPAWLYAAADVFVSASRHEGQPYSVGEAIACGLPVVLSAIPGTRLYEAAPDAVTVPVGDPGALAGALEAIAQRTPAQRAERAAANRAWAAQQLGIDRWCERIAGVYEELLAG